VTGGESSDTFVDWTGLATFAELEARQRQESVFAKLVAVISSRRELHSSIYAIVELCCVVD